MAEAYKTMPGHIIFTRSSCDIFINLILCQPFMRYHQKEINNIKELLKNLSSHTNSINEPIWFRGHAKKNWKLVPSIFRGKKKKEIEYLKEFKQKATLFVEPKPHQPHEWLFLMRHHSFPSRLLDWTESPLVATFFIVNDKKCSNDDGILWVILPLELNRNVPGLRTYDELPSFDEDDFLRAYTPKEFTLAKPENKRKTLAFLAPRNSSRMHAQLSVFTINHYDRTPLDKIGNEKHIWKYIIPHRAKNTLRNELELLQITNFQLFPELPYIYNKSGVKSRGS